MLRVFVDADVLFAASATSSVHSASLIVLRLAELSLIDAVASEQAIEEASRNLNAKSPGSDHAFRELVAACIRRIPNPELAEIEQLRGLGDPKDLPLLAAALREHCAVLVTHNVSDYRPGHPSVEVRRPGELVLRVRSLLASSGAG